MIPLFGLICALTFSVPRVGGGDPPQIEFILDKVKCSPRRRG